MPSPRRRSYSRSSSRDRRRRRRDSRERHSRYRHRSPPRRSPYRRSPRADVNQGNNVYIANFPPDATETDLKELFEAYGSVQDARIIKRYESEESKGFGFVTFVSIGDAEAAIEALDRKDYKGHSLRVEKAKRNRPRDSRRTNGAEGSRHSRRSPAGRSRSRSY